MEDVETKCKMCILHSGIVARLDSMTYFAKLAVIIFVVIGMAIVTFLVGTQVSLSNKLDIVTKNQIIVMTNLDNLKTAVKDVDIKINDHITNWPSKDEKPTSTK